MIIRRIPATPRRGAVVVMVAVSLVAVLAITAISIDGGRLLSDHRDVQAAADAAALAAASDLYENYWVNNGLDPSGTGVASAKATAAANGYTDGVNATVTVNIPPQSGFYTGKAGYAEVLISFNETRSFSNIFTSGPLQVSCRAVAIGSPIAANVGILVLDPTAKGAFSTSGGGNSTVVDTPVIVDSSDPSASIATGTGTISATEFDLTGGFVQNGSGTFSGPIKTNQFPTADPLASIPPPDPSTMTVQVQKKSGVQYSSGNIVLQPGVYNGGISASGTASLTLMPGIYYMNGGGFSFSGQGSLTGNGVMIYNAPGNGNSGGISVTGQGSINLSPPTSGIYSGLTFFQDRSSNVTGNISGTSGTTNIVGTFYFAGALLNITGNGGVVNVGSQYISDQLALGGNGGVNIQWTPDTVAKARCITLVE
jgi:hypothetical protein